MIEISKVDTCISHYITSEMETLVIGCIVFSVVVHMFKYNGDHRSFLCPD